MKINKLINSQQYYYLIAGYLIFTFFVALIGYGHLPRGKRIFTNREVSMLPLISNSSLTVVKPFDFYDVGDIITYYLEVDGKETIVTHRIAQIGGNVYVTKGDYNEAIDSEVVRPRLVIGKVVLIIPYLGLIFSIVKNSFGAVLFIILPAMAIILLEVYRIKKNL